VVVAGAERESRIRARINKGPRPGMPGWPTRSGAAIGPELRGAVRIGGTAAAAEIPRSSLPRSDPGGLTCLAEPFQLLTAATLAGFLIVGLASHLLAQAAALAKLAKTADRFLDRLARTDP